MSKFTQEDPLLDDFWMVRPCAAYIEEYAECTGLKTRFHQRYIYGHDLPCDQWKKDYDNCVAYRKHKSYEAAASLIESEKSRKKTRLAAAKANDIWEYRQTPPEDWSKPLPEYLQRMKLPSVNAEDNPSRCSIC